MHKISDGARIQSRHFDARAVLLHTVVDHLWPRESFPVRVLDPFEEHGKDGGVVKYSGFIYFIADLNSQ